MGLIENKKRFYGTHVIPNLIGKSSTVLNTALLFNASHGFTPVRLLSTFNKSEL